MLAQTIKAYPYKQYADDDDVRAFFDAYNDGAQTYVDWFNQVGLPYYPGLTGPLLDWVAEGLYDTQRPSLQQLGAPALGPLNTQLLNVAALNTFTPGTSGTTYTLTDDVFQRILTWNLYKGDGKNFCIRWLKRRVMRFFAGANGIDPLPGSPGFTVGAENTTAIGVSVSAGVVNITVHQANLVALVPSVTTALINIFALLLPSGFLELPARYTYTVTLV